MPSTLTTSEATELVCLTPKAIKNRLNCGELRYILKAGRRRIPMSELVRSGLLDAEAVGPSRPLLPTPPGLALFVSPSHHDVELVADRDPA